MTRVDVLEWVGSDVLAWSMVQTATVRLRQLNTVACAILLVYNVIEQVWPMAALNLCLTAINACRLAQREYARLDRSADG